MNDDKLSRMMADLNETAAVAERAHGPAAVVRDNNQLIAATPMPFDSTPYAFVQWLGAMDRRP